MIFGDVAFGRQSHVRYFSRQGYQRKKPRSWAKHKQDNGKQFAFHSKPNGRLHCRYFSRQKTCDHGGDSMKIGKDITDKKIGGISSPKESQDFEKFVKERRSKKIKEEEEEKKITSKMPDEKQPSDDKLADEMAKLATEKSIFFNNRQRALQDIEKEDNE